MAAPSDWLRLLVRGFLCIAFRLYYRSIRVQGLAQFPRQGPVLLVANHPNSLLDPAILIHLLPRAVHFGAKHTLFMGPLGPILEAFGAIPLVRASDEPKAMRRNLEAFDRYVRLLHQGRVAAIFPEGLSQDEPHLAPLRTGAARIALQAESSAGFGLGLSIVPVGLQFEPRRRFRAEVLVRLGKAFTVQDLAGRYLENRHQAVQVLSARISESVKEVAFHVEAPEKIPLVERLTEIYFERARWTGIAGVRRRGLRAELLYRTAACLNYYARADPAAVSEVERALGRYERLRKKAGVNRRLLEEPSYLLPLPLALVQAAVEALLGAAPALFGFLTGAIPYYLTKEVARRCISRTGHPPALSLTHILVGAIVFPVAYGFELAWVWHHFSDAATIAFATLLIPTGLFARFYGRRMQKLAVYIGGRAASWMKLDAIARVREAREELLQLLDRMRHRYRVEVLGWGPLQLVGSMRRKVLLRGLLVVLLIPIFLFLMELRDHWLTELPETSSPWGDLRHGNSAAVGARLERDARGVLAAIDELNRLEKRMLALRGEFVLGEHSYYSQEDEDEIHRLLLTYLNSRTALLRTVWTYRGAHDHPGEGEMEARAFLLAYASAATLVERASVLIETFKADQWAQRKLNEGDLAWGISEGTYDRLLASLSNAEVISELLEASKRFEHLFEGGAYGDGYPWEVLADAALAAGSAIERAAMKVGSRKLQLALGTLQQRLKDPLYRAQSLISTWIGDFRLKERPRQYGLITPQQVKELRQILRPGDILLERRNWFLSNAFLPGFWPHSALYLGDVKKLEELGVAHDPRVTRGWNQFRALDEEGHPREVIEAISEGVVFTSLEHSVGGADAVAVLRPRLAPAQRREAIARAFSHVGKLYDFEFDFFSTDRLVCSELVYRAYDGMLEFPLTSIMGRQTLPVDTFVRVYWKTGGRDDRPYDLIYFLDMDEEGDRSFPASEDAFLRTMERSRFTFLQ